MLNVYNYVQCLWFFIFMFIHYPNKSSVRADYLIYVANRLGLFFSQIISGRYMFCEIVPWTRFEIYSRRVLLIVNIIEHFSLHNIFTAYNNPTFGFS